MRVAGRRGFTVTELVVALVLLGVVTAGLYKVLAANQRIYQAQTQRIDLQQNLRATGTIFGAEFREVDAAEGDIEGMTATSITIRAMRQLAFICRAPVLGGALAGLTMTVRATPLYGARAFNPATDSLQIFYEGDSTTRQDDGWHLAQLVSVQSQNCPDNTSGQQLTANLAAFVAPQVNKAGVITAGSPVRGFEVVTYYAYQASDGKWYVGRQSAGSTQPVIGPIIGSNGLTFTYYDATGAVTAVAANVADIGITVRAQTGQPVQALEGGLITPVDSITTQVTLRNNTRF